MRNLVLSYLVLNLVFCQAQAQKQHHNWFFGERCAVDFNTSPPVFRTLGSMNQLEGSASFSDPQTGSLLFYTDGIKVWDKNHNQMPNGYALKGNSSSTHSAALVPLAGDTNRLVLFTAPYPNTDSTYVSLIDRRLNGGLGDIDTLSRIGQPVGKNQGLTPTAGDRLAITKSSIGDNHWVAAINSSGWNLEVYRVGNNYSNVTAGSQLNFVKKWTSNIDVPDYGCMKFSPDGKKLAVAIERLVYLFDFDPRIGMLSNQIEIDFPDQKNSFLPYGIEFSPNSRYLYVSSYGLIQFDLSLDSANLISASGQMLHKSGFEYQNGQLQLAPDGKIYYARPNLNVLGAVERPNLRGYAAGFVDTALIASPGARIRLGLPIISSHLYFERYMIWNDPCLGDTTFFSLSDTIGVDSIKWKFGDPSSGHLDSSSLFNPKHYYNAVGNYRITSLVFRSGVGGALVDTLIDTVRVGRSPVVNLGNDTTFCPGDTLFAVISSMWKPILEWDDQSNLPFSEVNRTGQYKLTATNKCGTNADSMRVLSLLSDGLDLGGDTVLCRGNSLTLDITEAGASYNWNNGSTLPVKVISDPGTYWVEKNTSCGVYRDTIIIDTIGKPLVDLGADTAVCDTNPYILTFNLKFADYLWQNGDTLAYMPVDSSATYWVRIENQCGVGSDTVRIQLDEVIRFKLGRDTTICPFDTILARALPTPPNHLWSTSDTSSTIVVSDTGNYWLNSENACGAHKDTFRLSKFPIIGPKLDYSIGQLSTKKGQSIYVWYLNGTSIFGEYNSTLNFNLPGVYQVKVTDLWGCEEWSDSLVIDENGFIQNTEVAPTAFSPILYPNPVHGILRIMLPDQSEKLVRLFDKSGRLVHEENIRGQQSIDLSGLAAGVYSLHLSNLDQHYFQKLIIR